MNHGRTKQEFKQLRATIESDIPLLLRGNLLESENGLDCYHLASKYNCSPSIAKEVLKRMTNEKLLKYKRIGHRNVYFINLNK